MSSAGEIAAHAVFGAAGVVVGALGLGLALGAFPGLVASNGLPTGSRLLVGALGGWFATHGLDAWVVMPIRPVAPWREAVGAWIHRVGIAFAWGGVAAGFALALGWLD